MKPLRDGVLIKQDEGAKEEKTSSGLILLKSDFDLYQFGDGVKKVEDILHKTRPNTGIVIAVGAECDFLRGNESVVFKKTSGAPTGENIIVEGGDVLAVKGMFGVLLAAPNYVIVKVSKESRDSLFIKKGVRDDGRPYELFVQPPPEKEDEKASQFFVAVGEIVSVGSAVAEIQIGDIGLLDYRCDNDESIIVGYDGEDKLIAVSAVSKRHMDTRIEYANRKHEKSRNQIVYEKGEYEFTSDLLGAIRGDKLIAVAPYVFLVHEDTMVSKKSESGIVYMVDEKIINRRVLAVSLDTLNEYGVRAGQTVMVDDFDVFDVVVDGRRISAINDVDLMATVNV